MNEHMTPKPPFHWPAAKPQSAAQLAALLAQAAGLDGPEPAMELARALYDQGERHTNRLARSRIDLLMAWARSHPEDEVNQGPRAKADMAQEALRAQDCAGEAGLRAAQFLGPAASEQARMDCARAIVGLFPAPVREAALAQVEAGLLNQSCAQAPSKPKRI